MKRVILIHGWGGSPEKGWLPWLRDQLTDVGFEVMIPSLPNSNNPTLEKWLPFITDLINPPDEDTFLVGHSLGCITSLRYLETLKEGEIIGGAILVAGFGENLSYERYKNELDSFFQTPVDWEKVKAHCKKFFALHSADDSWVDKKNLALFKEKLGADVLLQNGMKHYSGDDEITELQIVLDELLKMAEIDQES